MNQPSLIDQFRAAAKAFADAPAVIEPQRQFTFSQFDQMSDRVAASLSLHGIRKGDRVALYCVNSAEFAMAYVGIVKAGAVVVPVNLLQNPAEVMTNLNDAGVTGFIYHAFFQEQAGQIRQGVETIVYAIEIGDSPPGNTEPWHAVMACDAPVPRPKIKPEDDLVAILYTSGTTGKPKGAMLTHQNLVSNTNSVIKAMKWKPGEDRVLLVLPMFHAFAATVGMLTPLVTGCAIIPLPKFEPAVVAQTVKSLQATLFLGVPSMYTVLLHLKPELRSGFDSVRACVSGGASLPISVMRDFEETFQIPIYEGDGPTECSPVTCVNPFGGIRKPGTVGVPVPGVEMCILDEQGVQLPSGEIGEIAVRGASVMKGYWGMPDATQESFNGEWFLTGDLGTEDADGYFSILDRKKDMVIVNGMNVYPRMVEEVLYRFESIHEAAVIGQPDPRHGEILFAYVALKPGAAAQVSEIKAWCREHLGGYQVPRQVEILDELPKNATGKIMKRELRRVGEVERGVVAENESQNAPAKER